MKTRKISLVNLLDILRQIIEREFFKFKNIANQGFTISQIDWLLKETPPHCTLVLFSRSWRNLTSAEENYLIQVSPPADLLIQSVRSFVIAQDMINAVVLFDEHFSKVM